MIKFVNVFKKFNKYFVLNDLNFKIKNNEIVYIYSPYSVGKSTILKIMTGEIQPDSGMVLFNKNNIATFNSKKIANYRKELGIVFQYDNLISNKTLEQNIMFILEIKNKLNLFDEELLDDLLYNFNLIDKKNFYPEQLSFCEIKIAAFCIAVLSQPKLLLLDSLFDVFEKNLIFKMMNYINKLKSCSTVIFAKNEYYLKNTDLRIFYLNKVGALEKITKGYFENILDIDFDSF
jgi:ABC-type ATPase involved in cell division